MEQSDDGVRLLGSVTLGGQFVPSSQEATFLAVLAINVDQRVDSATIIDALWGANLPDKPGSALHLATFRVRKRLASVGFGRPVVNERQGYRLALDPALVDLHRFHRGDLSNPAEVVRALGEWRGDPFGGCVEGALLDTERVRARERRLRLRVRRAEVMAEAGELEEAVELLAVLREEHPADEGVARQAMTTLYRAGRQVDALAVFDTLRRHLAEEFGLDPSRELVDLHRRLLRHDAVLTESRRDRTPLAVLGREDLVQDLTTRSGAVVLLGEAGLGKSTLLRAVTERAGGPAGYGGWDEDGNPLTGWREALAPLAPGLALVAGQGPLVRDGLAELGAEKKVVVALDDVHLADPTSLGVLRHLIRVGVPAGVLLLLAARYPDTRDGSAWDAAVAELRHDDGVETVVLGLLDDTDALELAQHRLGRSHLPGAVTRLARDVVHVAAGHPLHLVTLLDLVAAAPDETIARGRLTAAPRLLAPLFVEHLARLERPVRRTVEALAVLEPIDLVSLTATLGRDLVDVASDLDAAAHAGVLTAFPRGYRVRHTLVGAAIRESLSPAYVAALHHARWSLPDDGSDPFQRLRHAKGAGTLVPPVDLATARADAGRAAYRQGALLEALDLLDAARPDLTAAPAVGNEVYRGLALAATGRREEADDVLDDALDAALEAGDVDMAVLAAVGDQRLGALAAGDGRRLARLHRVAELPLARTPRMDVLIATVTEEARALGRPRPESAAAHDAALAAVLDDDDPVLVARLRLVEAMRLVEAPVPAQRRLSVALEARAAAEGTGEPLRILEATELVLGAALAAGETGRVDGLVDELERDGGRHHRPRSRWAARLARAAVAQAEGEDERAERLADEAAAYGGRFEIPDAPGARLVHRMMRQALRGELGDLTELVTGVAAMYPKIPGWTAARAAALAQRGDLDEARDVLTTYRERRAEVGPGTVDRPGLVLAALAAHVCDDRETAGLVRAAMPADPSAVVVIGVGAAIYGPATFATGLAAATLEEHDLAHRELVMAEAAAARCGWSAWTEACRRPGDRLGSAAGTTRDRRSS